MANNIKINLDSKHLPLAAAAWQSWKIVAVVFVCGFIGVGVTLSAVTAVALLHNSLPKTDTDRARLAYQRQCQAQFALDNDGMRGDTGLLLCQAQAEQAYPKEFN
jgi:hypothetical protein